jgi:hypothetical protein
MFYDIHREGDILILERSMESHSISYDITFLCVCIYEEFYCASFTLHPVL